MSRREREAPNPYQPPRSDTLPAPPPAAPTERGPLEVNFDRDLPAVCLKCGTTSNVGRHVVVFEPPGTRGPLLWFTWWGALFWWLNRNNQPGSTSFPVPVCGPCDEQWKLWQTAMGVSWFATALIAAERDREREREREREDAPRPERDVARRAPRRARRQRRSVDGVARNERDAGR